MEQKGRAAEAEAEFEKLLGGLHVKSAMADLSKSDRGDEPDTVKFSELFYGRHFRGIYETLNSFIFCIRICTCGSCYFILDYSFIISFWQLFLLDQPCMLLFGQRLG